MAKVQLKEPLRKGAYANLYLGTDDLGRNVAVKLIRPSAGDSKFALSQAKALAKAQHPNIVTIHTIDDVLDPETNILTKAIIMEFLPGQTLEQISLGPRLTVSEIKRIGDGIINGLEHIHTKRLPHGDLHAGNVIIATDYVKIIDILCEHSLTLLQPDEIKAKCQSDLASLRILVRDLLSNSELEFGKVAEFDRVLTKESTISDIRTAFYGAMEPVDQEDTVHNLEEVFQFVVDPGFVPSEQYAHALSRETKVQIIRPLIEK